MQSRVRLMNLVVFFTLILLAIGATLVKWTRSGALQYHLLVTFKETATGFVFGAARESSDEARTEHGVRSALVASGIVFVMALVGGGMVVAQTVEERLELDPATTAPTSGPKGSGTSSTSVTPGAPAPAPASTTCPPDALPGTC